MGKLNASLEILETISLRKKEGSINKQYEKVLKRVAGRTFTDWYLNEFKK